MPHVHREALVPYSAAQMFALVNDVGQYPQFLPGCVAADILEQGATHMRARLTLAKAGIRQSFTTENSWQPDARIDMRLVDGPFRRLEGSWQFQPLGDAACKVRLGVDFEFASALGALAFGGLFEKLVVSQIDAFQQRARERYGRG